ncbi:hypothetical protein MuM161_p38 [Shewanella phage vB_SspS_MuM16-1]|nr:hypothetical protein MuM161_p38 [Shewanella phage vB_SspS_MuM16-1]
MWCHSFRCSPLKFEQRIAGARMRPHPNIE